MNYPSWAFPAMLLSVVILILDVVNGRHPIPLSNEKESPEMIKPARVTRGKHAGKKGHANPKKPESGFCFLYLDDSDLALKIDFRMLRFCTETNEHATYRSFSL